MASMSRLATTTLDSTGTPGTWLGVNLTVPGVLGGDTGYFEVLAYSTSAGSYEAAVAGCWYYYGSSGVFTCVTGAGITYNSIVSSTFSTWAAGTVPVTGSNPGARGAIALTAVPEPTSLALFGLGGAATLLFWRRRQSA